MYHCFKKKNKYEDEQDFEYGSRKADDGHYDVLGMRLCISSASTLKRTQAHLPCSTCGSGGQDRHLPMQDRRMPLQEMPQTPRMPLP